MNKVKFKSWNVYQNVVYKIRIRNNNNNKNYYNLIYYEGRALLFVNFSPALAF